MDLSRATHPSPYDFLPPVPSFTVTSEDITEGAPLPKRIVHDSAGGENLSPQLSWSAFPEATKSFAITLYDPDAPTGTGWWHWQVVNLPADLTSLPRGAARGGLPASAVEFRTDYGTSGYQGAAPPPGDQTHHYYLAVHALEVERLDLTPDTTNAVVGFHLTAHTLARGVIVGTYQH